MDFISFLIGLGIGALIVWLFTPRSVGALRVDNSDPDGPYLFLELKRSVHYVATMKTVKLNVKCEDFIPHE